MPFTVHEAKTIRIIEKAEGETGSEEEGFAAEDGGEVEVEDNVPEKEDLDRRNEAGPANDGSVADTSRGGIVSLDLSLVIFQFVK